MFKNMKIGMRLGLGFGTVFVLVAVIVGSGFWGLASIKDATDEITTQSWVKTADAHAIATLAHIDGRSNLELILATSKEERTKLSEQIAEDAKQIDANFDQLTKMIHSAEGKSKLAAIEAARKPYVSSFGRIANLMDNGQRDQAETVMRNNTLPALKGFLAAIDDLVNYQVKEMDYVTKQADDTYAESRLLMILASLIAIASGAAIAFWVTRSITRPIGEAVGVANRLADGDLTTKIEVSSNDETGMLLVAMQNMVDKLSQIIGEVRSAATSLSSAAEEVSATSQNLSQGSSEQAASVEQTSASIEQMSASINQNAENAKVTDGMASKAAKEADEGGSSVRETVSAMKSIAEKIGIIDDIAYQTNLLALNAAIEAARAGEHGKGFAVVATEVRKLAERSQIAAQEIGEVAKSSVGLAETAGKLLDEIVPSIKKTSDLVQEITAASGEQSSGASQINNAIEQLNKVTQQSASSSEELAATAEEMSGQAEELQRLMDFFKLDTSNVTDLARQPRKTVSKAARPAEQAAHNQVAQVEEIHHAAKADEGHEPLAKAVGAEHEFVRF